MRNDGKLMATQKAPVALTGGAGFEFEARIAARLMVDMLRGRCALGSDLGAVQLLSWQARESGWLHEDLVVSCERGGVARQAGLSLKSDRQVKGTGFPSSFVESAWQHWDATGDARAIRETEDVLVLVVGELAAGVREAWNDLLVQSVALRSAPERLVARMKKPTQKSEGSQASNQQRKLFASLHRVGHGSTTTVDTARLVPHLRLKHFDFLDQGSRDEEDALIDCQSSLSSGDIGEAKQLWYFIQEIASRARASGGSINKVELIRELRDHFMLRDHPDYERDWETLDRRAHECLNGARAEVVGVGTIPRDAELARLTATLETHPICILLGESGAGKSALVGQLLKASGVRTCWLNHELLDELDFYAIEKALGLSNPLIDVLCTSKTAPLVVFDALDGYGPRALARVAEIIELAQKHSIRALGTAQPGSLGRVLAACGEIRIHEMQIRQVTLAEVLSAVRVSPQLHAACLNPGIEAVVTNLKVLDWIGQVVARGSVPSGPATSSVSALIEWLWSRWIEGDELARSQLLMRLAEMEADTLSKGVPRKKLEHSEQQTLQALEAAELTVRQSERVFLRHDLVGDWARLHLLIQEDAPPSATWRAHAQNPRWHGAIRLYGQRLLEIEDAGAERWHRVVDSLGLGDASDVVLRDLLLDAVFLSSSSGTLLTTVWEYLVAHNGALLRRLLERFMVSATIADSVMLAVVGATADLEHYFRVPIWSLWGPLLQVLRQHVGEVVELVPAPAADICKLWLQSTSPQRLGADVGPFRDTAAHIAVALGRSTQSLGTKGRLRSNAGTKTIAEALLLAAPVLPTEVGPICLELAQRRHRVIVTAASGAGTPSAETVDVPPSLARARAALLVRHMPSGEPRPAWPDGPLDRVPEFFREACLGSQAFAALASALPAVAAEVLLATCIEEPGDAPSFGAVHENHGLAYWNNGFPPMFFRGPFLSFLREAPDAGVDFAIRLTNFVTERWWQDKVRICAERGWVNESESVAVGEGGERWTGDATVFGWSHQGRLSSQTITCVLMALERWAYEQLDAGVDISSHLDRITRESRSAALAGVLISLGKRQPSLFDPVLRDLLTTASFYSWDLNQTLDYCRRSRLDLLEWEREPARLREVANDWTAMPHRKRFLRDIALEFALREAPMREFIAKASERWRREAIESGDLGLRILAEYVDARNYTAEADPSSADRIVLRQHRPEAVQALIDESEAASVLETLVMYLPLRCRRILDDEEPFSVADADGLWDDIRRIAALSEEAKYQRSTTETARAIFGGLAVLLGRAPSFVADPERAAWLRAQLDSASRDETSNFAGSDPFNSPSSVGDWFADSFIAESGLALLVDQPADTLARRLVADAVTAPRYAVTALVFRRAAVCRAALGGDFERLVALGLYWAAMRMEVTGTRRWKEREKDGEKRRSVLDVEYARRRADLREAFVDRRLSPVVPSLSAVLATVKSGLDKQFADSAELPVATKLDLPIVQAALGWMSADDAATDAGRVEFVARTAELLMLSSSGAPRVAGRDNRKRSKAVPDTFEIWTFDLAASAIACAGNGARALWEPVLSVGHIGHYWVEYLCWSWFTVGWRTRRSSQGFAQRWAEMIEFALEHPNWEGGSWRNYDLGRVVCDLLGITRHAAEFLADPESRVVQECVAPLVARCVSKWFAISPVLRAFARAIAQAAPSPLLLPGIDWIGAAYDAARARGDRGEIAEMDGAVVDFLRACWTHERAAIERAPVVAEHFLELLTKVLASGGSPAEALKQQVLRSLAKS